MGKLFQLYRLFNILSLDVAAGAVISALFFARVFDVHIIAYGLISLGLTVWIIYTADHLLDARKVKQLASTERHRFHQRHFSILSILLFVAILIDTVQIFFIRKPVIIGGILLAVLVVIYFFVQRYFHYIKELLGAVLYSSGVLLAPLSLMHKAFATIDIMLMIQFGITALINLLLFSWFDRERDEADSHQSFTTIFGVRAVKVILAILFVANAVFAVMALNVERFMIPAVILLLMNAVLLIIVFNKKYFEVSDRYRLLGDAIFLLPVIYLLI